MKMLNRLVLALVVTLAINFIGLAIAAGLIAQKSGLDKDKIADVKEVLFPPPPEPVEDEAEEEPAEPTPMEALLAMLDSQSGKPADARVVNYEHELDARSALLDRQQRQLADRLRQLDSASRQHAAARQTHASEVATWQGKRDEAEARLSDEGFLATLALYESLPAPQAKKVIAGLEDEIALAFLRAMEPRTASKILREFENDEDTQQLRRLLEGMRQGVAENESTDTDAAITAGWSEAR
ncbi:MAG: hypothetical protein AAGI46_03905 [Planctomycetota bacterium]